MSNSYSALLRRSKLATFNPSIEQVFTSSSGQLSRSSFGFKRPLPSATTTVSPFVRVNSLDNSQKRTEFRKGTRETLYVRRWDETGHQVLTKRDGSHDQPSPYDPTLQSRFVPAAFADQFAGVQLEPAEALAAAREAVSRPPNFLDLTEADFEAWLESLTDRRQEFAAFVAADAARGRSSDAPVEDVNLYEHAQKQAKDLIALLNQFLAQTSTSPLLADKLIPHPHRTLGLQYAPITPLESSFAGPIPGRVLGSSNAGPQDRNGNRKLASVMGQAAILADGRSAGVSPTNFFPDANGERNPSQGRADFIPTAEVRPSAFATRVAVASQRGMKPFSPVKGLHEASALFERVVTVELDAVSPGSARALLPGEQAFSGLAAPKRRQQDFGLAALFARSDQAGKGEPRQLGGNRSSYVQQRQRTARVVRQRGDIQKSAAKANKTRDKTILDNLTSLLVSTKQ